MTELELDIKRVRDAMYLLERHGEIMITPDLVAGLGMVWVDVDHPNKYVYSGRIQD